MPLSYLGRVSNPREIMFEDRTRPHADNVGNGNETTAAIGIIKAVHGTQKPFGNRIIKDVVCFHAEDYEKVVDALKIDVYEPPVSQVSLVY